MDMPECIYVISEEMKSANRSKRRPKFVRMNRFAAETRMDSIGMQELGVRKVKFPPPEEIEAAIKSAMELLVT
jgi:hypothetical protein